MTPPSEPHGRVIASLAWGLDADIRRRHARNRARLRREPEAWMAAGLVAAAILGVVLWSLLALLAWTMLDASCA